MPKHKSYDEGESIDPLCVFCLSPRFSIGKAATSRSVENRTATLPAPARRLDRTFLFSVSKRKLNRKKSSASLNRTVAGLLNYKRRHTLSLEEILSTVQSVWKSPDLKSAQNLEFVMENSNHDNNLQKSNEFSPVLPRRRLSAPETVMRKHLLAQERSHSQDSKTSQNHRWETNFQSNSDPNLLGRKRDSNFMRKSTLLKRLWGNTKQKLPSSFQEWQHSYGKLSSTLSLNSCNSSPERLRSEFRGSTQKLGSPKRITPNKISMNGSPKRMTMVLTKTQSLESASNSNTNTNVPPLRLLSQESTNNNSRGSATTKYTYSSFTTYSDNSDSAYTNSLSNNYYSSNAISSSTSTKTIVNDENCNSIVQRNLMSEAGAQTQDVTNLNVISNIKLSQKTLDVIFNQILQDVNSLVPQEISISTATVTTNNFNSNSNLEKSNKVPISSDTSIKTTEINDKESPRHSSTNTTEVTLERSSDIQTISSKLENAVCDKDNNNSPKTNNNTNIKEVPVTNPSEKPASFFLKINENSSMVSADSERIKNYIISNIESGSTYIRPTEDPPVVPRFSAIPRTSSMEVNTSNGENENEESDSASFVDSLEDFNSPRILSHDEKPVGRAMDIYDLLPDSSKHIKNQVPKSAAFFIPIEVEKKKEVRSVSELLPLKVRQRLNQRQQKREEKCQQIKAANSFRSLKETVPENKNRVVNAQRKRLKPVLPRISMLSKSSKNEKPANKENHERRAKSDSAENCNRKRGSWTNRGKRSPPSGEDYFNGNGKPMYEPDPSKIYQKTEIKNLHKRIEILEIMECIEVSKSPRDKSKIPIPVHHHNRKLSFEKPIFLDTSKTPIEDPKLDQLIANILIDTLNHDIQNEKISPKKFVNDEKHIFMSEPKSPARQNLNSKYRQKFDAIPEEMSSSLQSTSEEVINNNIEETASEFHELLTNDANKNIKFINVESPPPVMRKDDSTSSIPKGWITFYTVRNDVMRTPESTSDEGKLDAKFNEKPSMPQLKENYDVKQDSAKSNATYKVVKTERQENLNISSSSEERSMIQQISSHGRNRKPNTFQRKNRMKNNEDGNERKNSGEWSVTISGSNSYGQTAPDVEMRLKFPNQNKYKAAPFNQSHSDSGLGEDNSQERNYSFPKIENNRTTMINERDRRAKTSFNSTNEGLPRIQTNNKRNKKRESSLITTSTTSMILPRQNKASTCRYQFSRPRETYSLPDVPSRITERHYSELLRRFPEILAVTGRSISPERKLMERDYYE